MDAQNTPSEPVKPFYILGEYITLGQLLKASNMISSGGMVRHFLGSELVLMNGEPEARRGRKLREGDVIHIPGKLNVEIAHHTQATLLAAEAEAEG